MRQIAGYTAWVCLWLVALATPGLAQQDGSDDTGTNPVNFTYDARLYMEMSQLPEDVGSAITTTYEFRAPFGRTMANLTDNRLGIFKDRGDKYALRLKTRHKSLNFNEGGQSSGANTNVSGIGDMDARFLAIPHAKGKFALATGLEAYFPTATNDALGDGRYALVPQVFLGFFGLMGEKSIFAPGYLYVADVGGDSDRTSVDQHKIDVYFVWLLANMKHWLIINPQANFDVGNDRDLYLIDAEFGFMVPQLPGASTWLRPGVGFGDDKPFDWTLEFGFKFIWR